MFTHIQYISTGQLVTKRVNDFERQNYFASQAAKHQVDNKLKAWYFWSTGGIV